MLDGLLFPIAVTIAGVVAHECAHYLACRAFGAPASPTFVRKRWIPVPAIDVGYRNLTPTSCRIMALSPLLVLVPSLVAVHVLQIPVLHGEVTPVVFAARMWLISLIPSAADWRIAYNAADVELIQAVAEGPHPAHQAAEGIA